MISNARIQQAALVVGGCIPSQPQMALPPNIVELYLYM